MLLENPGAIVEVAEVLKGEAEFLDVSERPDPQELLFQGAPEPLDDAVALRFPHERRARGRAQEPELVLVVPAQELTPVIVADREAQGDALLVAAEMLLDPLTDGLERLEAIPVERGVDADALGGAVIHDAEDRRRPLLEGHGLGRIGAGSPDPNGMSTVRCFCQ